jgi:prepilin-type N-terminal cleavage/methylation domain-containing protein
MKEIIDKLNYKIARENLIFTLVELLVVIFIVGVLATLVLPALHKAKDSARRTQCKSNLHGIGQAMAIYLDDYQAIFPPAAQMPTVNLTYPRICEMLAPYLDTQNGFACPTDKKNYYQWR